MNEKFCQDLLGLPKEWAVKSVEQNNSARRVTVRVAYTGVTSRCPVCERMASLHDWSEREVQDLDMGNYETYLSIRYPRIDCPVHGRQTIKPPFVDRYSRFTQNFEKRVLKFCGNAPVKKAAKDLGMDWHAVEGIKARAFARGKEKRSKSAPKTSKNLGVDDKSFNGHDYVTIIIDRDRNIVLDVLPDRTSETLARWFKTQQIADLSKVQSITMDMWQPYIKAVRDTFPNADQIICFDRFHVAQLFTRTVDTIRRRESARFREAKEDNPLVRTRFDWLRNSRKADNRTRRRREFLRLTELPLETAKAWKLKEHAAGLWEYVRESTVMKKWRQLVWRLSHSRIQELSKLAKTVKSHLRGILNAIKLRANNAAAEARNSCIQRVKYMACGYRDKARFSREIIFQYGGLDLAF